MATRRLTSGWAVAWLLATGAVGGGAQAQTQVRSWSIGQLSWAEDPRFDSRRLEKAFPDAPLGRSAEAIQLSLDDAHLALQSGGWTQGRLVASEVQELAELPQALDKLLQQGIRHVLLELPADAVAAVAQAARGKDVVLYNTSAPEDRLRGVQCAANLLHTLPSHAMQMDALGQFLASRKWLKPLVLVGQEPDDAPLLAAFQRSAKRFGLKPVAVKPFKWSNDPRERELGNPRLLTAGLDHEVVVVVDSEGSFARELPYRTQLPRPVLGSNGLNALAWSPWYERHGAPQLNKRFFKRAKRGMGSHDWAAWVATRAAIEAVSAEPKGNAVSHLKALKSGQLGLDGYKGLRMTFRPWDGQLRQAVMLVHGNGQADMAPVEGFLHPRTALDSLGFDEPETACKGRG